MITVSIDVDKLNKDKFFKGKKGTYLDLVLIETPEGKYGDYVVKQNQSKEDRESGEQMPILGNAKILKKGNSYKKPSDDDEIPF